MCYVIITYLIKHFITILPLPELLIMSSLSFILLLVTERKQNLWKIFVRYDNSISVCYIDIGLRRFTARYFILILIFYCILYNDSNFQVLCVWNTEQNYVYLHIYFCSCIYYVFTTTVTCVILHDIFFDMQKSSIQKQI